MPNADEILNLNDIETDLINLKDRIQFVERSSEEENIPLVDDEETLKDESKDLEDEEIIDSEDKSGTGDKVGKKELSWHEQLEVYRKDPLVWEDDEEKSTEMGDGGVDIEEFSLESYGISLNTVNTVYFVIGIRNLFKKEVVNLKIVKTLPKNFDNLVIIEETHGSAVVENNQLVWNLDRIESETNAIIKFTSEIQVETLDPVKTGFIQVDYTGTSSFTGGIELERFKATTKNSYYMDIEEQDEEPGLWDCRFVFKNTSEFQVEITDIDIHASDDPSTKFVSLDAENLPTVASSGEWQSDIWTYKSENFPSFKRNIEFRVLPDLQAEVTGNIVIDEIKLILASITGEVAYEVAEMIQGVEQEENIIKINSFADSEIETTLSLVNNGSAPLNEVSLEMGNFSDVFQPPNLEVVKLLWDGTEIDIPENALSIEEHSPKVLVVSLDNLKDATTGMLLPNSKLEAIFPVHAIKPPQDADFSPTITYKANTYPRGQEIVFVPSDEEVPEIQVVHIRRKFRK